MLTVIVISLSLTGIIAFTIVGFLLAFEIDYRRDVKKANEQERLRKEQGKSIKEWYATHHYD